MGTAERPGVVDSVESGDCVDQIDRRHVLSKAMYVVAGVGASMAVSACAGSTGGQTATAQSSGPGTTNTPAPTTKRPESPQQAFEALTAGNERFATGAPLHPMPAGEFAPLTDAIKPAVDLAKPTSNAGEQLQKTIDANAKLQAELLTTSSPALADAVKAGTLTIVPSVYDLKTGKVRILS